MDQINLIQVNKNFSQFEITNEKKIKIQKITSFNRRRQKLFKYQQINNFKKTN